MALTRVWDLKRGLKEWEKCLNLLFGSPNNPVITLRALRVSDLGQFNCCLAFVCTNWDWRADEIIHQSSNGLRSLTSGVMLVQIVVSSLYFTVQYVHITQLHCNFQTQECAACCHLIPTSLTYLQVFWKVTFSKRLTRVIIKCTSLAAPFHFVQVGG